MPDTPPSLSTANSGIDKSTPAAPDRATLESDANAVLTEAKSVAGKLVNEATEQVGQLSGAAQAQVTEATEKFKGLAGEQKELFATQIGGVADALQRVASDLESEGGASAQYARTIADGATRLSTTLRDNDVDDLVEIAQDFGRRQPAAFMGAAALLGFAASRFVLASAKRRDSDQASALGETGAPAYQPATGGTDGAR